MLSLLLFAVAGVGPYELCEGDTDCTAPDECVADVTGDETTCRAPCTNDTDCGAVDGAIAVCGPDDRCALFCDDRGGVACPAGFACIVDQSLCAFVEFPTPPPPVPCACDADCVDAPGASVCADVVVDEETVSRQCVAACSPDDSTCPTGTACTMRDDAGYCLPERARRIGGQVCLQDAECVTLTCELVPALLRNACIEECEATEDCTRGLQCTDGLCLATDPFECPVVGEGEGEGEGEEEPSCGALAVNDRGAPFATLASIMIVFALAARRARGRGAAPRPCR